MTFATTVNFDHIHGRSVFINGNTGGSATFAGDITATPDAGNNAIELSINTGQSISFLGNLDLETPLGGGKAFTATGGGTLLVTGTTNKLKTIDGTALEITGMTLDTGGATFKNLDAGDATNGPTNAIMCSESNTGGPITVGDVTAMAGETGTIQHLSGMGAEAIVISNSANATINGIKIDQRLPASPNSVGVHVTKDTATTTQTVNLGDMEIDGGATGIQVTGGGTTAGTLTMTVNDTNINGPTATGIQIGGATANLGVDNGSIAFTNTKVDGMNATATAGVQIQNSNANITFDTASSILGMAGGSAFIVDNGTAAHVTYNGTITTPAGPASDVEIKNVTGGSVTFSPTSKITDTGGKGINVHDNTGGTFLFQGTNSLQTADNDAVTMTNNTGSSTTFASLNIVTTGGNGFNASGGGTVEVDGNANTISFTAHPAIVTPPAPATPAGNTGLSLVGMIIGNGGVTFKSVMVDGASLINNGIVLTNNTGGPITIGAAGNAAGDGGTIQNTIHDGIAITDTANVTLNGVKVNNAGTVAGDNAVLLKHDGTAAMSVTMNNLQINTAQNGVHINGTGGTGTFNVSSLGGSTIGAVGNSLEVQGAVTNVNDSDTITNSAGRSINVHALTAGTVTHTGTVNNTAAGTGVLIDSNTGGNVNLLGTYNITTTGANNAVTVTNNTGATVQLTNLNLDTVNGTGFLATGGGTLSVTGTTNVIDTTGTGVGLDIENMTIGGSAAPAFQHVNVNGALNGIKLLNLTGGQVAVGNAGGAADSGGTLSTTGDAIIVTNVQSSMLRNLHVTGGTIAANIDQTNAATSAMDITIDGLHVDSVITGAAVDVLANSNNAFNVRLLNGTLNKNVVMSDTGSGTFGLLVDDTSVTSTGTTAAFDMEFSGAAHLGNLVFRNGDAFQAGDANALLINSSGAGTKTVNLLVDGTGVPNTFTNASAGSFAADFLSQGGSTISATIQGNTFDNATAAAKDFDMKVATSTSRVILNLGGTSGNELNTAAPGAPTGTFILDNIAAGTFTVFDKTDTLAGTRNNGTVTPLPNAAAITDTATAPIPPTAP